MKKATDELFEKLMELCGTPCSCYEQGIGDANIPERMKEWCATHCGTTDVLKECWAMWLACFGKDLAEALKPYLPPISGIVKAVYEESNRYDN